ncbi:multidrug and toxin extrusion protein 1-like [Engraulis encrasicolus]|uniref:multidrug and toxin extrusion protein 1-like n=1 Tax=Engraulis encrasicolus TaxID=184585 RepID=UPI002FD62574
MDNAGLPEAAGGGLPVAPQLSEETAASGVLFRWGWSRRVLPLPYREELYHVLRLTGPLFISRILNFMMPFVITIWCGHLGNVELGGYALASALINCTTAATGFGLAMACDTLVSQTFGSKNLKRVGEILQRSILIILLFCLPCWAVLINSETLLLALWQEPEVARITQLYCLAFLPAVPAMFLHQLQVSYLQNQGIILPQMYTAAVANIINVFANWFLINKMELGVKGSAVASSLSTITLCLLLFGYIHRKQLHKETWRGWSSACLQEWGTFMQLAVPSTLMLCFEWWIYEIGSFLAGMFGEVELSAQHIVLELGTIAYMLPLGINAAVCVRVGNSLGAGDDKQALVICKVGLALCTTMTVLQAIVLASIKSFIGYLFTNDEDIVGIVSKLLTIFILLQLFDGLVCVSYGVLVGAGKQKIVAISNLVCYYCFGLPAGITLMFKACLGILGLWLGLLLSVVLQACFFVTCIFKLDWRKAATQAQKRAGKKVEVACVEQKLPVDYQTVEQKPPVDYQTVEQKPPVDYQAVENTLLPEKSLDVGATVPGLSKVGASCLKENGYSEVSTEDQSQQEGGKGEGHVEQQLEKTSPPSTQLSVAQLVLRRGLAALAAAAILVVGVVIHLSFPPDIFHNAASSAGNQSLVYNCTAPF